MNLLPCIGSGPQAPVSPDLSANALSNSLPRTFLPSLPPPASLHLHLSLSSPAVSPSAALYWSTLDRFCIPQQIYTSLFTIIFLYLPLCGDARTRMKLRSSCGRHFVPAVFMTTTFDPINRACAVCKPQTTRRQHTTHNRSERVLCYRTSSFCTYICRCSLFSTLYETPLYSKQWTFSSSKSNRWRRAAPNTSQGEYLSHFRHFFLTNSPRPNISTQKNICWRAELGH